MINQRRCLEAHSCVISKKELAAQSWTRELIASLSMPCCLVFGAGQERTDSLPAALYIHKSGKQLEARPFNLLLLNADL